MIQKIKFILTLISLAHSQHGQRFPDSRFSILFCFSFSSHLASTAISGASRGQILFVNIDNWPDRSLRINSINAPRYVA